MTNELNLANVLVNGGVIVTAVTTAGWFFKKWMNERETEEKEIKENHAESTRLIIANIKENREFYSMTYDKLGARYDKLDTNIALLTLEQSKLALYQKDANGKVGLISERLSGLQREHDAIHDRLGLKERSTDKCNSECS